MQRKKIVIEKSSEDLTEKNIVLNDSDNSESDTDTDLDNDTKMKNRLTNQDFQITTYTVRSVYTDFLEDFGLSIICKQTTEKENNIKITSYYYIFSIDSIYKNLL